MYQRSKVESKFEIVIRVVIVMVIAIIMMVIVVGWEIRLIIWWVDHSQNKEIDKH